MRTYPLLIAELSSLSWREILFWTIELPLCALAGRYYYSIHTDTVLSTVIVGASFSLAPLGFVETFLFRFRRHK
uniref:Putative secreted peptide n=1 Tax=Anopheles braziliensis TaxID=58242 RepID=A0A2M3ZMD2_9DIPT